MDYRVAGNFREFRDPRPERENLNTRTFELSQMFLRAFM